MRAWLRELGGQLSLFAALMVCYRVGHDERTIIWNNELRVCCARCGKGADGRD